MKKKKIIFWIVLWVLITVGSVAGFDNLFFQPALPGIPIGIVTLSVVVFINRARSV